MAKVPENIIGIDEINEKFKKSVGGLPAAKELAEYIEAILEFAVSEGGSTMLVLRATAELYRLTLQEASHQWIPVEAICKNAGLNPPGGYGGTGLWYYRTGRVDTVLEAKKPGGTTTFLPNTINKTDSVRIHFDCIRPIGVALDTNSMKRILR